MADAQPEGQETRSDTKAAAPGGIRQESRLPMSGRVIVMSDLTGEQELAALGEAGSGDSPQTRQRLMWAQAMRSCISLSASSTAKKAPKAETFDHASHTCESFRALFSSVDFQLVVELFMRCNRPTEEQAEAFRKSTRIIA